MMKLKFLFLFLFVFLLNGCISNSTNFGVMMPKKVYVNRQILEKSSITKNVQVKDTSFIFIVIPFGEPNLKVISDELLKKGEIFTNVRIENEIQWYVLFGFNTLKVTADVIKLPGGQ